MDSAWAHKQRLRVTLTVGGIGFLLFAVYIIASTYRPPTCFDGKHNQDEAGIDCGGSCDLYCTSQIAPLTAEWTRVFEVSPDWWSALAYVRNPNLQAYAKEAPYRFRIYDKDGGLILEREGITHINGEALVPVFEGRLATKGRAPYQASFEWLEPFPWVKKGKIRDVSIEEQKVIESSTVQEIQATLRNKEPFEIEDIVVTAIVYDRNESAIAASQTLVESLAPRGEYRLSFSWPRPFTAPVGRVELVPRMAAQQ